MVRPSSGQILSAAAAFLLWPATYAQANDADVQAELRALRERVAQLEKQVGAAATTQAVDPKLVEKAVSDVLADANRRRQPGSLLPGVAGFDRGFYLASSDGNFLLRPGLQFQFRGVVNSNADGPDDDDQTQSGFALQRFRFRFDGHVFDPRLTYRFIWDAQRQGGTVAPLDAFIAYQVTPDWSIRVGQFMDSWTHERDVNYPLQMAAERSNLDTIIGGNLTDRVQGIAVTYGGLGKHHWRSEFTLHDGAASRNTDFRDEVVSGATITPNSANWGFAGRVEYKPFGEWEDIRDFTAKGTQHEVLLVGAGFDLTQTGDRNVLLATVDAHYETASGWSFYGGVIGNFIRPGSTSDDLVNYGFIAQAAYLITPSVEAFARYNAIFFDEQFTTGEEMIAEITVGMNYYFFHERWSMHRLKFTLDANYLPNGVPDNLGRPNSLARPNYTPGTEGQFTIRAQLNLNI